MPGFRDQEVRFPFGQAAAEVNRTERARQLAVVRGDLLDRWAQPSRCTGWTVHDVVRHVMQMNELLVDTVEAARAGRRAERVRGFDRGRRRRRGSSRLARRRRRRRWRTTRGPHGP